MGWLRKRTLDYIRRRGVDEKRIEQAKELLEQKKSELEREFEKLKEREGLGKIRAKTNIIDTIITKEENRYPKILSKYEKQELNKLAKIRRRLNSASKYGARKLPDKTKELDAYTTDLEVLKKVLNNEKDVFGLGERDEFRRGMVYDRSFVRILKNAVAIGFGLGVLAYTANKTQTDIKYAIYTGISGFIIGLIGLAIEKVTYFKILRQTAERILEDYQKEIQRLTNIMEKECSKLKKMKNQIDEDFNYLIEKVKHRLLLEKGTISIDDICSKMDIGQKNETLLAEEIITSAYPSKKEGIKDLVSRLKNGGDLWHRMWVSLGTPEVETRETRILNIITYSVEEAQLLLELSRELNIHQNALIAKAIETAVNTLNRQQDKAA